MEQTGWYVAIGEESYGPIQLGELHNWLDEQRVTPEHYIWHETLGEWKKISDVLAGQPPEPPQPPEQEQPAPEKKEEVFYCEKHPDKSAEGLCALCKKDFCDDCLTSKEGKFYCSDCLPNVKQEKKGFFSNLFSKKIITITGILALSIVIPGQKTFSTPRVTNITGRVYTKNKFSPLKRSRVRTGQKFSYEDEIRLTPEAQLFFKDNFYTASARNSADFFFGDKFYLVQGDFRFSVKTPDRYRRLKKKPPELFFQYKNILFSAVQGVFNISISDNKELFITPLKGKLKYRLLEDISEKRLSGGHILKYSPEGDGIALNPLLTREESYRLTDNHLKKHKKLSTKKEVKKKSEGNIISPKKDNIPPDLYIVKLMKDERGLLNLTGITEPGARVYVDGVEIPVSPLGLFTRADIPFVRDREPFIEAYDNSGNVNRFPLRTSGTRHEETDTAFLSAATSPASITFDRASSNADPDQNVLVRVTVLDVDNRPVPQRNVYMLVRNTSTGNLSGGQTYNITGLDGAFLLTYRPSGIPGIAIIDIQDGVSEKILGTVLIQLVDIAPGPPDAFIVTADPASDGMMNISYQVIAPEIDFAGVHLYRNSALIGTYTDLSRNITDNLGTGVDGTDFSYEIRSFDDPDPNELESPGLKITLKAEDRIAPQLSTTLVQAQPDRRHVDIDFTEPLFAGATGVYTYITSSGISGPDPTPPSFSFEQFITTTKIRIVADADMQGLTTYRIRVAGVKDDAYPSHNEIIPATLDIINF